MRGQEFSRWWRLRDRLSVWIFWLALKVEPRDTRPPCPDCGTPGYADLEAECPVCRDGWEEQQRMNSIHDGGYRDGFADAEREAASR